MSNKERIKNLLTQESEKLLNCVHCGLCLDQCPTYKLTGNESNSPRGRLAMWRAQNEGRADSKELVQHYTSECLGCLACETACPANVPYGEILMEQRQQQYEETGKLHPQVKIVAGLTKKPGLMKAATLPVRIMRNFGFSPDPLIPTGKTSLFKSSFKHAINNNQQLAETKEKVRFFTGCHTENFYPEINFATLDVLKANGIEVEVPASQQCCGALHEHTGLHDKDELDKKNCDVFDQQIDVPILTNAAGCGLSLKHALKSPVKDVLSYLGERDLTQPKRKQTAKIFIDMPCHLYHGQGVQKIPQNVLEAIGEDIHYAPSCQDCCGAAGTYNIEKAENSTKIIDGKVEFLNEYKGQEIIITTANAICMQQWHAAVKRNFPHENFKVKHIISLLAENYT
ncbi:MAG: (Fe-S)-binding protein [Lentisphaeria bacterium]|nr:(Fe-S)-binding protein [Lentisphaeria bacterium]